MNSTKELKSYSPRSTRVEAGRAIELRRGQSLVEVLVAVAIGGLIIGSAVVAITVALRSNLQSKQVRTASVFLQEMLDNARSATDGSWHGLYNLDRDVPTYVVSDAGILKFVEGTEGVLEKDVSSGLVGHWKFDEASGVIAYDSSLNGNKGDITCGTCLDLRPTPSECKISSCLNFDGADDRVTVSANSIHQFGTGSFSISLWSKADAQSGTFKRLLDKRTGGTGGGYSIESGGSGNEQRWFFRVDDDTGNTVQRNVTEVIAFDGEWHNIVLVINRETQRALQYFDGILIADVSAAALTGNVDPTAALAFSATSTGGNLFLGSMDDIRIYSHALQSEEIAQLYSSRVFTRHFTVDNVNRTSCGRGEIDTLGPVEDCNNGNQISEDPSTQKVTGFITWPDGPTLSALEYFTRTRNQIEQITDWSDPTSYSSQDSLDPDSTPGEITLE